MNVQEATNLTITEGEVKAIHDSSNRQLWGRLNYDTTYKGDTTQATYSGKNIMPLSFYDTSDGRVSYSPDLNFVAGTYTASFDLNSYEMGTNTSFYLRVTVREANNTGHNIELITITPDTTTGHKTVTFTTTYDVVKNNNNGVLITTAAYDAGGRVIISNLQIEAGPTATTYEPYVGGIPAPNPDYPQTVNVVTGTQTITLTDGEVSDDYTVTLGSTELVKLGTYQDYIYKTGDNWYLHKETGFISLDSLSWQTAGTLTSGIYKMRADVSAGTYLPPSISSEEVLGLCTHYGIKTEVQLNNLVEGLSGNTAGTRIFIYDPSYNTSSSASEFQTWINTAKPIFYYVLATATNTQITDTSLISELNAIHDWLTRYGYTATVAGNLPLIISQTALT